MCIRDRNKAGYELIQYTVKQGDNLGFIADWYDCRVNDILAVSYTHLRAHETPEHLVCRLLLDKKTHDGDGTLHIA